MAHTRVMVGRPVSQSVVSSKLNSVSDLFFFFFPFSPYQRLACLLACLLLLASFSRFTMPVWSAIILLYYSGSVFLCSSFLCFGCRRDWSATCLGCYIVEIGIYFGMETACFM
ncbi:hypothetical protein IWZ01DRAFT_490396 [Phyllosticta capitalensis]